MVAKWIGPIFKEDYALSIVTPQSQVVSVVEGWERLGGTFFTNVFSHFKRFNIFWVHFRVHGNKVEPITGLANSFLEKWGEDDATVDAKTAATTTP